MTNTLVIFYWSDGTWVPADEYRESEFGFKGDDFGIIALPSDSSDSDIETEIANRIH